MGSTVHDVVRDVVAQVAPEEKWLADLPSPELVELAVRASNPPREVRREPVGFGLPEAVAFVTPVVWIVVQGVTQRGTDAFLNGAGPRARAAFRKLLGRPAEPLEAAPEAATVPTLTQDQLRKVRWQVLRCGSDAGLDDRVAETLADAVVGRLALGTGDDSTPPDETAG
ncbi:hypothetical protein JIX56_32380 [Streptomyces sp. CA-210063]|uniref:hypothetical protein n=1 Tax=Streptomyces sp. CA-210063 TaxID=2801029 RepID=UPI00214C5EFD|nr:hypothetical protein [Streptomyces sp. CA-210063]UUU34161.1 hypothetical protein JIX56_32380 [Streptomyces sp. CA-210063]